MDLVYDELIYRNTELIKTSGITYDELLNNEIDNRYCLAISHIIDNYSFEPIFYDLIKLLDTFGMVYHVNNNDYKYARTHFTLLQLIGFDFMHLYDSTIFDEIHDSIKDIIHEILPIKINFKRLAVTKTNVILLGYPDKDINRTRDKIRDILSKKNIVMKEPFKNNIAHITIMRFNHVCDSDKLLQIIDQYTNNDFGSITINNFGLYHATWKMNIDDLKVSRIMI